MFNEKFSRDTHQFVVRIGKLHRFHFIGHDAAPHAVRMASALFFMEDDGTRHSRQAEFTFDPVNGSLEFLCLHPG